jgi:hypothetical protein
LRSQGSGALEQGRLGLNVRLFADERDRRVVTGLTYQFLLTFLGADPHTWPRPDSISYLRNLRVPDAGRRADHRLA